jgi:hypothetical protein
MKELEEQSGVYLENYFSCLKLVLQASSQLGSVDQLTPEDLLDSKKRPDDNSMLDACATEG